MSNRAYANLWIRGFNESNMLAHFGQFLATAPVANAPSGFTEMVVRAVDFTQTPLQEYDLRAQEIAPRELVELAQPYAAGDACFEVEAVWELWVRDMETVKWKQSQERLALHCYGPEYDDQIWRESGHLMVDLGLEHLFTGHAGLLVPGTERPVEPRHPDEARFLMWMSQPQNLRDYQEKTRENIQKLLAWMRLVEESLPVERLRLWSEGEDNFEARLDEILAVR
jgi:hypothetical protein